MKLVGMSEVLMASGMVFQTKGEAYENDISPRFGQVSDEMLANWALKIKY